MTPTRSRIPFLSARPTPLWLAIIALFGGVFGLGVYTFVYAEGTAYLQDDPKACANCHVMRDVFDSWNRSKHHGVAVCNDCHTPHTFPEKYIIKGINGMNHSYRFTSGDYPVNIRITELNRQVVLANCINCHGSFVNNVVTNAPHGDGPECIKCHEDVGH